MLALILEFDWNVACCFRHRVATISALNASRNGLGKGSVHVLNAAIQFPPKWQVNLVLTLPL